MKKKSILTLISTFILVSAFSQFATLGTGALKDKIWWIDWAGFTIANGASKSFTTTTGLLVQIEFSNVTGPPLYPYIMNTQSGALLHNLYDFTDPSIKPALFNTNFTGASKFILKITVTRDNLPVPFSFIAADAEGSDDLEITELKTTGAAWKNIDFFRNSSQINNPIDGCNTQHIELSKTFEQNNKGQNPVVATRSGVDGQLTIETSLNENNAVGGMAVAFGIFAPVDRGDLPASYGYASHDLSFSNKNECNFLPPFPGLVQDERLKIGNMVADADGLENSDDNSNGIDEDGLTAFPYYYKNGTYTLSLPIVNTTASPAYLTGYFDYDQNGTFDNGESVTVTVSPNATEAILNWTGIPLILPTGTSFAFRFRLSSDESAVENPSGHAIDGEVEDYFVPINALPEVLAAFSSEDTVCTNSPVSFVNGSINASSYFWSFCSADVNTPPVATNMGNLGNNLASPVFMDYAFDKGNYYGFVVNNFPGGLVRLDFGNSLLNTPISTYLGNFGGIIPESAEGIQVVQNNGIWYAIITGGRYNTATNSPRILKIKFGTSLNNPSPIATNWGNIGDLAYPIDLHLFQNGTDWYGFTLNSDNNTITRFNFSNSFENTPTAANLGNIGQLNAPTGIYAIYDNGNWYVFITNEATVTGSPSLTRLDFGNSLLNSPTATNLGNPDNLLLKPRDLTILRFCGQITAFVVNGSNNQLIKLDFHNNIQSIPTSVTFGDLGNLSFPHSISKIFRQGADLYSFTTNVSNNTLTRFRFIGCTNSSIASSSSETPPPVTYSAPGTYNINLTINEGLPTQSSFCKQIVVLPKPSVDFSFTQDICAPSSIQFNNESTSYKTLTWDFGNGTTASDDQPVVTFDPLGTYTVKLKASAEGGCSDSAIKAIPVLLKKDSVIINRDTILCENGVFQLRSLPGLKYCWSPAAGLSATDIASPVITGVIPKTTYYVNALTTARSLINNGDFSQGNTGFTSGYSFANPNNTEGQYYIGAKPPAWNGGLSNCGDHSTGTGNMMFVNGNPTPDATVWKTVINVIPNTTYAFSTWIEALHPSNPAQLQFSINGQDIGNLITASLPTCTWSQFYTVWNAGSNTTATISIINKNTLTAGNDFALDDISFGELQMVRDSITVTINANPKVDFNYNIPFCKSVELTGLEVNVSSPVVKWDWSLGDNGHQSTSSSTFRYYYLKGGKYTIKLIATDNNTCKDSTRKDIQLDTITAAISPDTIICKNTPVTLRGSGGTIFEWTPVAGILNNGETANPEVRVAETTRFYLKVKNGIGCEDTTSVLLSIKARPAFVKPSDKTVCADSTIQLKGGNGNMHHYLWSPAATLDDPEAVNPVAAPSGNTAYQVIITESPCGYDTTFNVNVIVNPNPEVTASKERDIDCINPTTRLAAEGTGLRFEWSPLTGVDYPSRPGVLASADSTTTFVVKNTNEYNCSAFASVIVKVTNTAKPVFVVPNAFTPNNDGINDCFGIKQWGNVVIHEFSVFNRWGQKVFSTKNPRECWNGMYKGQLQPGGGYVYTIRASSFCGELVRNGSFILVR